jgi:phenylacetate-coenzyme A ligase PaaK-like adenylate-forming protein
MGVPVERWFTLAGSLSNSGHYQVMTRALVLEARLLGVKFPFAHNLPQNDFTRVARWIAQRKSQGADILFITPVSFAVRIVAAAADCGIDVGGTVFLSGAEPLTYAKRAAIEAGGAKVFSRYGISELGWVGWACPQMTAQNCVHIMKDSMAVISHRRRPELSDVEVDSLLFTPLLPFSSYVLINVEMDDCGILEPAGCTCPLKEMGFTEQIRDIFSFGKLTGQGITLLGADMLGILEKSLPNRFGGTPTDYQLVEREGHSQTEIELRVSPRVKTKSAEEVRHFFLAEVKKLWGGSPTFRLWSQTNGVQVVFAEPIISGDRKINPLHLLGPNSEKNHAT